MKAVSMPGRERIEVIDVPEPEPSGESVVVKVLASTICGSEHVTYRGEHDRRPRRLNSGHEAAGIVWKTDGAQRLKEGDRVAIYAAPEGCGRCAECLVGNWILCLNKASEPDDFIGTHSQFIARREQRCLPLPDDISFEDGAVMLDCVGTPYRAIKRLGINAFDTVLITGMGPIGAAAATICKFLGAVVIAAEISETRLNHAKTLGIDHALNPNVDDVVERVRELTQGRGVSAALDCTGLADGQLLCLEATRTRGRIAFVGVKPGTVAVSVMDHLLPKELTLIGTWYLSPAESLEVAELIQRGLPIGKLITHRFGIDEAATAFDTVFGGKGTKVIIDPWAE